MSAGEKIVEGFLEVRGVLRDLAADLIDVLLVALLDLFPKNLLERAVAEPFFSLLWEVRDHVGHERSIEVKGTSAAR